MKFLTAIKCITILIICFFLGGTIQIGFSISANYTELVPQTMETKTSFDPFIEGWTYRKQITVNHSKVTSDLIDFPVVIYIIDPDLSAKAQSNAFDILFMDSIGVAQQLNHEIETYNSSSGELVAWVNIPYLSSTVDTIFYMYYGNLVSSNQQHPQEIWNSTYQAVWHMNDATPSTIIDSTSNMYTGTKVAPDEPSEENGKLGKGQYFDGSDDYIQYATSIIPMGTKTISGWMKRHTWNTWGVVLATSTGISSTDRGTAWTLIPGNHTMECYMGDHLWGSHFMKVYIQIPDLIKWHYYTMTYDGTTLRTYIDGKPNVSTTTTVNSEAPPDYNLRIGETNHPSLHYPLDAELDEFRITDTVVSAAWIATEYSNQNNSSSFMSINQEEKIPVKPMIAFGKISNVTYHGDYIWFEAVKLRCIQFSPFSFTPYKSYEHFIISNQYRGLFTHAMALVICQAYH